MNTALPFFNWSIRKLLLTEPATFSQARIKILYTILLFSLLKVAVVLATAFYYGQDFNIARGLAALVFYGTLLKLMLSGRVPVTSLVHITIWLGIIIIWTNIFISIRGINIITLQFVFMAMMSSFYFLNRLSGIVYSVLASLPVIMFFALQQYTSPVPVMVNNISGELAAPGNFILVLLNFLTLIIAHFLYHQAFNSSINEKELLNLQLKKAVEEAKRHAQSKSDFLSTMSHELRTPLNSVIGMTDLLLEDPHDEEQKENLNILRFSASGLHTLINDILDFNKLESEKLQLEEISVNLSNLLENICSGLELQAKEKGLKLILDVEKELKNIVVISDPTRITQIIYNLAGNGIKFTAAGSVTVSLKLLEGDGNKVRIRFSVTDTGIGISPEKHSLIFEPFVQASANTTRNFGGSGLGLSIVKHLLTLFDSRINLVSNPGEGAAFYFDITFETDHNIAETGITGTDTDYDLAGLKVLVAEDNRMNIVLIRKLFARWKVEPAIAENGLEAVEKAMAASYDVILMDIHMPEMDGYEATKQIREMNDVVKANVPIIALTASVSQDMITKIREVGMNDIVRKPFNARDLYSKLKGIHAVQENTMKTN